MTAMRHIRGLVCLCCAYIRITSSSTTGGGGSPWLECVCESHDTSFYGTHGWNSVPYSVQPKCSGTSLRGSFPGSE
ncbi:uncharacterized protein BJX67DRAFT_352046 [Aspergillus lucknowensis]|uniref:Secreted protein n=1 Tax=Aspergillus lucknowensis TaxID=176173 RepID=A0ABR4LT07_9EURO